MIPTRVRSDDKELSSDVSTENDGRVFDETFHQENISHSAPISHSYFVSQNCPFHTGSRDQEERDSDFPRPSWMVLISMISLSSKSPPHTQITFTADDRLGHAML
ncbi:hypothetical protein TNCV_1954571 [Trichonephila clavipes]|nr:hypothetical protein TNCV_1954571 [Trichonephila clavipes]